MKYTKNYWKNRLYAARCVDDGLSKELIFASIMTTLLDELEACSVDTATKWSSDAIETLISFRAQLDT